MTPISAVIIAYNEAANIERCLQSLAGIADELLVLDSYSTDETAQLAEAKGAKVVQRTFDGYIGQKNAGNEMAQYSMILSLDADEALSDELRTEILALKEGEMAPAYRMNRLNHYCGKAIKHGEWYPDKKIRLFDRRKAKWGGPTPHEVVEVDNDVSVVDLKGELLHWPFNTVDEHRAKADKYASMAAESLQKKPEKWLRRKRFINPTWRFFRAYVLKGGILDGWRGRQIAGITAWEVAAKYRRALQMKTSEAK